jgi:hypothetical protein
MNERKDLDLRMADHAHLDRRWQEDRAWLELSGNVPARRKGRSEGIMGSFEKNPMLWAFGVIVVGGVIFFLVTRILA